MEKSNGTFLSNYFKTITTKCKKWELALWWIVRLVMIAGAIESFVHHDNYEDKIRTMMIGNTALTFGWELFMLFPKKHMFSHIPSYVQNVTSVYIFLTAFMGAYRNFYYCVWWWDTALHFASGGILVIAGLVFMRAYEERDGIELPVAVVVFAAFCTSFMFGTMWECWEFYFDQTNMHAEIWGDTQHWCLQYADPSKLEHLIFEPWFDRNDPNWQARFALMDTMTDIVANTLGACIGGVGLKIALHKQEKEQKASKLVTIRQAKQKVTK